MLEPDKEQLLEKLKSIKGFNLDNSFELAFDKQFMVPYSSIDDVAQLYPEYGGNAIYIWFCRPTDWSLQTSTLITTRPSSNIETVPQVRYIGSAIYGFFRTRFTGMRCI